MSLDKQEELIEKEIFAFGEQIYTKCGRKKDY